MASLGLSSSLMTCQFPSAGSSKKEEELPFDRYPQVYSDQISPKIRLAPPLSLQVIRCLSRTAEIRVPPGKSGDRIFPGSRRSSFVKRFGFIDLLSAGSLVQTYQASPPDA